MFYRIGIVSLLLALGISVPISAQPPADRLEPLPDPPVLPEKVQSGESLEPDITILQRPRELIYEYRIHGRLYAIKVVPENAPPYYLVDADGDGQLETRATEYIPTLLIPQWVLFSW